MKSSNIWVAMLVACLFLAPAVWAQGSPSGNQSASSLAPSASTAVVPQLIKFSGTLLDEQDRPMKGPVGVTFALYGQQSGGAALWLETQNMRPDENGNYTVLLGVYSANGVPAELFTSGEARWLGVQVGQQPEQPRVLLVSVPYALKAGDAQTLGGKPVSAFVTTDSQISSAQASTSAATSTTGPSTSAKSAQGVHDDSVLSSTNQATASIGGTGATNFIPRWTNSTTLGNSLLFQAGANVGLGTTTPTQKFEVDSGNMLVRGLNNFKSIGNTAFLYVGDTNHPIEAIYQSGLAIGAYLHPHAIFIADFSGNVGIGTTTPTSGILSTVANSKSVVGLSAVGWNAPAGSNASGTDAIHATGGNGDPNTSIGGGAGVAGMGGGNSGVGVSGTGGMGNFNQAGAGVIGLGGHEGGGSGSGGGPGMVAKGGSGEQGGDGLDVTGGDFMGDGVVATGGSPRADGGTAGVVARGGPSAGSESPGVLAIGGSGGGDGIDAFASVGSQSAGVAGSFTGDVQISGNLNVSGTKSFRIDHPLDPANKYLYHAVLESSEVLNLYTGNAVLDASGEAAVQLPDWFETLNRDFRYQLTAIGAPAPNLHIAQEMQNHSFRIAGGAAGMKVSWQVTGTRQDAWEKAHPMAVEVEKPRKERGYYINPELFGAPPEMSMEWARNPRLMKRMKDMQEKQAKQMQVMLAKPGKSAKP
jgi:hypothetical protein